MLTKNDTFKRGDKVALNSHQNNSPYVGSYRTDTYEITKCWGVNVYNIKSTRDGTLIRKMPSDRIDFVTDRSL
jgi:hypothetical protein